MRLDIDISEQLCTPEQAIAFKAQHIIQLSRYAWVKEGTEWVLEFETKDTDIIYTLWKEPIVFAAYDNTQLGLMLQTIGYFPAGPAFQEKGVFETAEKWWCDDINHVYQIEASPFAVYGQTEAEAKANMLLKLLKEGRINVNWDCFDTNRMQELLKGLNTKQYGKNNTDGTNDSL